MLRIVDEQAGEPRCVLRKDRHQQRRAKCKAQAARTDLADSRVYSLAQEADGRRVLYRAGLDHRRAKRHGRHCEERACAAEQVRPPCERPEAHRAGSRISTPGVPGVGRRARVRDGERARAQSESQPRRSSAGESRTARSKARTTRARESIQAFRRLCPSPAARRQALRMQSGRIALRRRALTFAT